MFATMMDQLPADLGQSKLGFTKDKDFLISALLWVDDVVICTNSPSNEIETLNEVNEFALKHKIKWGQNKCKVMRIGKHNDQQHEWNTDRRDTKIQVFSDTKWKLE